MRRTGRLWRSTPFRLALALVALFAVVLFASFAATYVVTRDTAEAELRQRLTQQMAEFRALPSARAIATVVEAQSEAAGPEERIVSYVLPGGRHFGNAAIVPTQQGYRILSLEEDGKALRGPYLALTEPIHGGLLTVAITARPIEELRRTFLVIFGFSLLPTALLGLAGGLFLARRSERRLRAIENALDRLTEGDYAARVPEMGGRDDDLIRIAQRINRMAEAQEAQVAALRQVSADIAHDLKTPIQRLAMRLSELAERADLPVPARDLAAEAVAESREIVQTFQALLQIAQIEGGSPRARFAPVDLGEVAETFVEIYEPAAEESGHRLCLERADSPVVVEGDRALLGQALANLIENALRHTPPQTEVAVRVVAEDGTAILEVADRGPGIPEAERDNVLRRLYRLESSRTTPGSGLGLALVKAIAELHGGRVQLLDNRPGLRATLRLPIRRA